MRATLIAIALVQVSLAGGGPAASATDAPPCSTEAQARQRLVDIFHDSQPTLWRCSDDALTLIARPQPELHTVREIVSTLNRRFKTDKPPQLRLVRTLRETAAVTVYAP